MSNTELTRARRRIRTLERCLQDVSRILFERAVELNAAGRDKGDNPEFHVLRAATARINRTLD